MHHLNLSSIASGTINNIVVVGMSIPSVRVNINLV